MNMMNAALQWMTGIGGLIAWITVVLVIIGVVLFMRFLANHDGAGMGFRQLLFVVVASVGVLILAGGGGLLLMRAG